MHGKKICHLTLLNPAVHSRIFFKEARTQQEAGFSVSIIGQDSAEQAYTKLGIRIVPIPAFSRKIRDRIHAQKHVLALAIEEKADLYHVHSPELLGIAKKLKEKLPQSRIVYDMHEDYFKNIRFGGYYPPTTRIALSQWVRRRENRFLRWGDGVIYAEDCYHDMLNAGKRGIIIRNKFRLPETIEQADSPAHHSPTESGASEIDKSADAAGGAPPSDRASSVGVAGVAPPTADVQQNSVVQTEVQTQTRKRKAEKPKDSGHPILLYTGTIAPQWGMLTTLELWSAINEFTPAHLVVAGHTHSKKYVDMMLKFVAISGIKERFTLEGGNEYLPYERIVELIESCAMGTAFYDPRENIRDRIPTKFYEFMAFKKPLFVSKNPTWDRMIERLDFGVSLELPIREEALQEAAEMITHPADYFYRKPISPADYSWETEADRLIDFDRKLLQP